MDVSIIVHTTGEVTSKLTTVVFIAFYSIDIYQIIINVDDLFILIFFWHLETGSHVMQIGLRLAM